MFKTIFILFLTSLAPLVLPLEAMSFRSSTKPDSIGVRTLRLEDEARKRPVVVELWYPTDECAPSEENLGAVWVHPKEARNVSLSKEKKTYPLIVMSHGNRGDRRDRSWLAEHLVKQGFIVASLEHHGNAWTSFHPLLSLRFWDRARDVSFAIDRLLEDPLLKTSIDPEKIGFVGYSLGGTTGIALGGGIAHDFKEALYKHKDKYQGLTAETLEGVDFSEAYLEYKEPRIKAILLICPAVFIYPAETLKKIRVPIGLIATLHDEVLPHEEHAYQIVKNAAVSKLKILRDKISHFAFLNRVTEDGKKVLPFGVEADGKPDPIHEETGRFAVDFFRSHL